MPARSKHLSSSRLRYFCEPSQFKFKSTAELKPLSEVIGQERAVAAIDLGVNIKNFGFNIFAVGPVGAGRTSTIKEAVQKCARDMACPHDWCYVNNFFHPDQPVAIRLKAGMGKLLVQMMSSFISQLSTDIPNVVRSEDYQKQRQEIIDTSQRAQNERLAKLEQRVRDKGFGLKKITAGLIMVPLADGKPLTTQQIEALPAKEREKMEQQGRKLQEELNEELTAIQKLEYEAKKKLDEHQRRFMGPVVQHPLERIREEFRDHKEVLEYLKSVEEDLLNNVDKFFPESEERQPPSPGSHSVGYFGRYHVNLIVDNSKTRGAPVIVETNPTYNNLVGRIDRIPQMGTLVTDFSMIRSGSLHRANGGFLIIEASQLFQSPMAWQALKRSLKNRSLVITDLSEEFSHISVKTLEPEPIPLDVKIIIIGNNYMYNVLLMGDEEFKKLFKIKADFSLEMELTAKNILNYAGYIAKQCQLENLLHLTPDAVGRVVEYGTELVGNQTKLSTRFTEIRDLLVESNYWATKAGHEFIEREDIQRAFSQKKFRLNKYETRLREMIEEGTIFINTTGEKVGEVNGLAYLDFRDYVMGKPARITAKTFLGQGGVIAIDREAKMSGSLHNKGILTLSGYLNGHFGVDKQLSMSASITFEQSYE
ncbi:MAG TPA: ATP-dependent protease, partial [bacterium]|nr:ATP-dependent protease [bacterium]